MVSCVQQIRRVAFINADLLELPVTHFCKPRAATDVLSQKGERAGNDTLHTVIVVLQMISVPKTATKTHIPVAIAYKLLLYRHD